MRLSMKEAHRSYEVATDLHGTDQPERARVRLINLATYLRERGYNVLVPEKNSFKRISVGYITFNSYSGVEVTDPQEGGRDLVALLDGIEFDENDAVRIRGAQAPTHQKNLAG